MSYNSYRSNRGFYNGPYEKKPQGNYGFHQTYRDKNVGRGSPWYKNGGHRPKGNHSSSNHRTYSDKQSNSRSSSSGGAPNIIESRLIHGTDPMTLKNGADSKFTKLLHHRDFNDLSQAPRGCDNRKNYKIIYDPELDKSLSKSERKIKHRKIRYGGETVLSSDVIDPRKTSTYFSKPNKASKKYPFKQLPQPRFQYDKDSLGPPPRTELIVWDLPSTTSEVYLTNFVKSYGNPIKDLRFISDPENGVSLGISVFKFHGSPHSAMRRAEEFLNTIKLEQPKIDGVEFKVALNDADGKLLMSKEETAKLKLRAFKIRREEEIKKQKKKLELEDIKKEVEEKRLERKSNEINLKEASKEQFSQNGSTSKYQPNTTVLSVRKNNRLISGVFLPKDLRRVIKTSPYILVQNKYVPAKRTSTMDVKRCLSKYDWTSVISDFTGYYIVFNSLKECERCFYNEDGRKFYEYRMFMEMAVPEGCNVSIPSPLPEEEELVVTRRKSHDVVDEAANMLIKDFETFLAKDIRERVIAPIILDLLGHDKYPELLEELRMKDSVKESERVVSESSKNLNHNSVKLTPKSVTSIKRYQSAVLPSFKKKQEALTRTRNSSSKSTLQKRNIIPLQHALNFDNDSDESENDQTSVSTTPAPRLKRAYSSAATSSDEAEKDSVPETKKSKVSRKPFVYDSSSEEEQLEEEERDSIEPDRLDAEKREGSMSDVEVTNEMFQPTPKYFNTVYPEISYLPSDALDLDRLQDLIKDEEDLQLAFKILEDVEDISKVPNIEYFAWKQKQTNADWQEIAEDVDLITELDSHLESTTGSFRSEGYRKIPEADKIGYMPLRRRKLQKPIKTVQQEEDEHPTNTNSIQSSRVNRANNRRFAADVAQSGNETEVLSLNTLTKRKKPVSFARSAIHNWGLYALEPIAAKEMIIEYVGESIRQQVAEHRERSYMKTGIGSSYLFRIDENTVIDATKKGGIARFINHCCNPSCTAKIIKVEGKKRIVIYALKDIEANEELTYDYKFERETNDEERIRCLCGAPGCKGYLN